MKTEPRFDFKRMTLVFIPAILILAVSGVLASPELNEIAVLREEAIRDTKLIREAERVRPLLKSFKQKKIAAIDAVDSWLKNSIPVSRDPRMFMADIRLAELRSGCKVDQCREYLNIASDDYQDEDTNEDQQKGTTWSITLQGSFHAITKFMMLIQRGERIYLTKKFGLWTSPSGKLEAEVRLLAPGLHTGTRDEEGLNQ